MKVPCRCEDFQRACCEYYRQQAGAGLSVFRGARYQHGNGGLFSKLWRAAIPLIKQGAKAVGRKLLKTGADVLKDVSEGRSLKESAEHRLKESGKELLHDIGEKISQQGKGSKKIKLQRKRKRQYRRKEDIFD